MKVSEQYLSSSKQQTLRVFWVILGGGLSGRSFGQLSAKLGLSDSALLKELHNLAEAGYVEKRNKGKNQLYAVSADFIERFGCVLKSFALEVR